MTGIPEYSLTTETIGQSYEGADLRIAKICRGGCGNKPAMYIEGGIHVRVLSHTTDMQEKAKARLRELAPAARRSQEAGFIFSCMSVLILSNLCYY